MSAGRVSSTFGRGIRGTVALVASGALAAGSLSMVVPAANAEDDRDSVAAQVEAGEARVEELRSSLEGIDANLAKVFLELEGLNASIPVAQSELDAAQVAVEAAHREHQAVVDQLEVGQAELSRLRHDIEQAEQTEEEVRLAIGNYARALYLEGDPSALSVMLTDTDARDISQRVAANEAMTRMQHGALEKALQIQEQSKNQVLRQGAVEERISRLEEKARAAAEAAEESERAAEAKLGELTRLQANAASKKKEWESKKATAVAQLAKQEAEYEKMKAKLAAIDEENRKKQVTFATPAAAPSSGGFFNVPLRGDLVMTSPFGWRIHPVLGTSRLHNGTDFGAGCGTPIYAAAPGVVSAVTFEEAGGNVVYVNHGMMGGSSFMTAYVHMEATNVYPGQSVDTGSVVGWVGTTGYSTGCHLHFSVMQNGSYVDPMDYL